MPSRARITIRLTPTLEALLSDDVRQGRPVSDIVREALEAYLRSRPTSRLPPSDTGGLASDDVADKLADIIRHLEAHDQRLTALEAGTQPVRQRQTRPPRPGAPSSDRGADTSAAVADKTSDSTAATPTPAAGFDRAAATHRMQALHRQGLSLAQIAAMLDSEGIPTQHGKPWHKGTVGKLLKRHGR